MGVAIGEIYKKVSSKDLLSNKNSLMFKSDL